MHQLEHLLMIASLRARNMGKRELADDLQLLAGYSGNYVPEFDGGEDAAGKLNDEWSKKQRLTHDHGSPSRSAAFEPAITRRLQFA